MAERQYTRGLLGYLTGFDPNNPNAPKAPSKPTIDQARRTMMKERQDRLGAETGDGNIYKNGAGTAQSAQRMGMPVSPTKSGPVIGGRGGGGAIGRMPLSPTKSGPVAGGRGGGGAAGRMTTQKAAPAVAPSNPPSRPTAGRPPELPFSRKSPEAAAKQVVANAAAMGIPKAKPTPAPKQSWWDKFSEDHKLSAAKSYADYKKLMESM